MDAVRGEKQGADMTRHEEERLLPAGRKDIQDDPGLKAP